MKTIAERCRDAAAYSEIRCEWCGNHFSLLGCARGKCARRKAKGSPQNPTVHILFRMSNALLDAAQELERLEERR
jgi:hypothetical protein